MPDNKTLNVGAGKKQIPGAVNIDVIDLPGLDYICDITLGIPEKDNTFDKVIADYVLCQIQGRKTFIDTMNEIWRVLKPGGVFEFKVPDAEHRCAFQDPMDCRYFVAETFDYFDMDHYRYQAFDYGFKPWEIVSVGHVEGRPDRFQVIMRKPNG